MFKSPFMPRTDLEKQNWLQNFSSKIGTYATKYNIAAAQVTDMQNSSAYFNYWMDYHNKYSEYLGKLTEFKMNCAVALLQEQVPG